LTVGQGVLDPIFDPSTTLYYDTLPEGVVFQPSITYSTSSAQATAELDSALDITSDLASERTATITVTAEDGNTKQYKIEFFVMSGGTFIENAVMSGFVYPIPATDILNIGINYDYANLYNILGEKVMVFSGNPVDISTIDQGVYFMEIVNGTNKRTQRIIIQ
jgi:hypothetical protein